MPTWSEILDELRSNPNPDGSADFDGIRRKYMQRMAAYTGRRCIAFYSAFLTCGEPERISIQLGDMAGLMEVCRGVTGPLDILVHSPGGDPAAAASIVRYLWKKYPDIRVFVPLAAMSAATLLCFAGNRIVMGKHSQLGPIDPQFAGMPAGAILADFRMAQSEAVTDPRNMHAWQPLIAKLTPGIITQLEQAIALSKALASEWLGTRMLAGTPTAAESVADYFGDFQNHKLHSMGVDRDIGRTLGLIIDDLEGDQQLQDAVLSVHHAMMHTFAGFGGAATKIIENDAGRAWFKVT